MKNIYEEFNVFLESIHSGSKVFKMYRTMTNDDELNNLLAEIVEYFEQHETSVSEVLKNHSVQPTNTISPGKELIVWIEKVKTQMKLGKASSEPEEYNITNNDDDLDIGISALKSLNMGITKGLEFVYIHRGLEIEALKKVIKDYGYLYDKLLNFIVKKYLE